jgi:hypothetical protein
MRSTAVIEAPDASEVQALVIGRRCVELFLDVAAFVAVITIAIFIVGILAGIHLVVILRLANIVSS